MGVERERAKGRMMAGKVDPTQPVAQGMARDVVGEKLGVSGETVRRSLKVVEKIDELRDEGETDKALELTETLNTSISRAHQEVKAMDVVEAEQKEPQLIIDMDDPDGVEKAIWDYARETSMAVRWRKFVGGLLKMCIIRDSIIKDFNPGDFLEELKGMRGIQLSDSHESLMDVLDWLTNLIRDMEDANNG